MLKSKQNTTLYYSSKSCHNSPCHTAGYYNFKSHVQLITCGIKLTHADNNHGINFIPEPATTLTSLENLYFEITKVWI